MPTQQLLTRGEFEAFAAGHEGSWGGCNGPVPVLVRAPYELRPCDCGDVNCHGWRFVEVRAEPDTALRLTFADEVLA